MPELLSPAFLYLAAAAALPFLAEGRARSLLCVAVPVLGAVLILLYPQGTPGQVSLAGWDLTLMRVDRLSTLFGLVFSLGGFLAAIYAWHLRDAVQQSATLVYAGSAIGAVFAGDLVTLFLWWEGTAIASVVLIWAQGSRDAFASGMRYLVMQVGSGVFLLAGAALHLADTGSFAFDTMTLGSIGTWLIFLAFGVKAAFPFLHTWLQDSYPAASVTGTVVLSIFTTKLAVYALARGFAGTEMLIWIGTAMALFPILFALVVDDLRRVLSYSLNHQLGFMVVGVGLGTEMSLNGTAAHATASVLYQSLLFMAIGAVLFRTGTARASELGGLWRSMPVTAAMCLVGAASISAVPLFSGFVAKSPTLSALGKEHYDYVWAALYAASIGAVLHSGIRVPLAAFFGADRGLRPQEAPTHMIWAMGATAALCVLIGILPGPFFALLPFEMEYPVYTFDHILTQLQLLAFVALVVVVLWRRDLWLRNRAVNVVDFDWLYRRAGPSVVWYVSIVARAIFHGVTGFATGTLTRGVELLYRSRGPDGARASAWPLGAMVMNVAILLGVALVVIFLS